MKKIFCALLLIGGVLNVQGQVEFGVRAGLNSIDLVTNAIKIQGDNSNYELAFNGSQYGHHFGLYSRIKVIGIYVEPAVIFNSNSVSYNLDEYSEGGAVSLIRNETYNNLDIPLMVGLKAGAVRIFGGPVAHIHISSTSDLFAIKSYSQKFKDASYGYQAGFGLDIWKIRVDLAYEGNLSRFGDHITFDDQSYSFSDSASRVLLSLGYAF